MQCFYLLGQGNLLRQLDTEVAELRNHQFATATKQTYTSHLRCYLQFCTLACIQPIPASTLNVCRYIAFLSRSKSFSSIQQYINIISLLHRQLGLINPMQDNYSIASLMKGIKRVKGQSPAYKLPLSLAQIQCMGQHLNLDTLPDMQMWCIILSCFFGLLRISSVTCDKSTSWIKDKTLLRQHVSFCERGCILSYDWSKTIQFRQRSLEIPLPRFADSSICPATAFLRFFAQAGQLPPNYPALAYLRPDEKIVLPTPAAVRKRLATLLKAIGISNTADYNSHSLRRSGACFLLSAGVPTSCVKVFGDWKSDAVLTYLTPNVNMKFDILSKHMK